MLKRALWPYCKVISAAAPVASVEDVVPANHLQGSSYAVGGALLESCRHQGSGCAEAQSEQVETHHAVALFYVSLPLWPLLEMEPQGS
jgi:hypothetical protein